MDGTEMPGTHVADVHLHVELSTTAVGAVSDLLPACDPIPLTGLPCLALVGENVPCPAVT